MIVLFKLHGRLILWDLHPVSYHVYTQCYIKLGSDTCLHGAGEWGLGKGLAIVFDRLRLKIFKKLCSILLAGYAHILPTHSCVVNSFA